MQLVQLFVNFQICQFIFGFSKYFFCDNDGRYLTIIIIPQAQMGSESMRLSMRVSGKKYDPPLFENYQVFRKAVSHPPQSL